MAVMIAGCYAPVTKQFEVDDVALEAEAQEQRKIYISRLGRDLLNYREVSYRVLTGAAPLCGETVSYWIGTEVWTADVFDGLVGGKQSYRDAAMQVYGLSSTPQVVKVYPGSPAERAGVRVGDVPLGIDEWSYPTKTNKKTGLSRLFAGNSDADDAAKIEIDPQTHTATESHEFRFLRDGEEINLPIRPVAMCDYTPMIRDQDQLNAFADGQNIYFEVRMLRWLDNNDQMGVIVGHEVAHNIMEHSRKKTANATGGAIVGGVVDILFALGGINTGGAFSDMGARGGAAANSPEFESEADYVGLYAAALGGMDITEAPELWRAMSIEGTHSIDYTTTHPRNPYRAKALEKAIEEIRAKQAAGEPLQPDMKEDAKP